MQQAGTLTWAVDVCEDVGEVVVAQHKLDAGGRVGRQPPQLAGHPAQHLRAHVLHVGHRATTHDLPILASSTYTTSSHHHTSTASSRSVCTLIRYSRTVCTDFDPESLDALVAIPIIRVCSALFDLWSHYF